MDGGEEEDEQEEDDYKEELDVGKKVRSVFKYAYPPSSNLCTATNISKSFPPSPPALDNLFTSFLSWRNRREEDGSLRGIVMIITGPETRRKEEEREREKWIVREQKSAERTKRSREPKYIRKFKSSIRNNEVRATIPTRRYGEGRGLRTRRRRRTGGGQRRDKTFSRGLSVDPDER